MSITYTIELIPPIAPPITHTYIDHIPTLNLRNELVAAHGIGVNVNSGFIGISNTTGFTEYICTTGEEFFTALSANQGISTTKKLIKLRWNGVQNWAATTYMNGPSVTEMAQYANPSAYGGYDIMPHATKIVADVGYTPIFGSTGLTSGEILFRGWGKIHFDGIHFQKGITASSTTDRPGVCLISFTNCTFNVGLNTSNSYAIHLDNNVMDGPTVGHSLRGMYVRVWNTEVKNKNKLGDLFVFHGYGTSYTGKDVYSWIAGTVMHSGDAFTTGDNHFDFVQYGVGTEQYASFNMLGEFNLANCNMPSTQGMFGDASGTNQKIKMLWHNNLMLVNAYHGIICKDPSGTGELRIYRNTVLRAATPAIDGTDNHSARVSIFKAKKGQTPTTGIYDIRENYANSVTIEPSIATHTTDANNILISANPGTPNYIGNLFTGNGSFGVNSVGRGNYSDPGFGLTKAAAKLAMRNFFEPLGGYRVNGAGMTDPSTWSDIVA